MECSFVGQKVLLASRKQFHAHEWEGEGQAEGERQKELVDLWGENRGAKFHMRREESVTQQLKPLTQTYEKLNQWLHVLISSDIVYNPELQTLIITSITLRRAHLQNCLEVPHYREEDWKLLNSLWPLPIIIWNPSSKMQLQKPTVMFLKGYPLLWAGCGTKRGIKVHYCYMLQESRCCT